MGSVTDFNRFTALQRIFRTPIQFRRSSNRYTCSEYLTSMPAVRRVICFLISNPGSRLASITLSMMTGPELCRSFNKYLCSFSHSFKVLSLAFLAKLHGVLIRKLFIIGAQLNPFAYFKLFGSKD